MTPAPKAAVQTAIAVAIGSISQPDNNDSTDLRTIPLKTSSSRIPPSIQATTMPAMSLALDCCIRGTTQELAACQSIESPTNQPRGCRRASIPPTLRQMQLCATMNWDSPAPTSATVLWPETMATNVYNPMTTAPPIKTMVERRKRTATISNQIAVSSR